MKSLLPAWLLLCGLACDSLTEAGRDDRCQQTYEFGNWGCARVEGQVLGLAGQGVGGAAIFPLYVGSPCCNSPVVVTDREGEFGMTIHLFTTAVDSAPAFIRASYLGISDSVRTTLKFAPIGEVPPVTPVLIPLSVP